MVASDVAKEARRPKSVQSRGGLSNSIFPREPYLVAAIEHERRDVHAALDYQEWACVAGEVARP